MHKKQPRHREQKKMLHEMIVHQLPMRYYAATAALSLILHVALHQLLVRCKINPTKEGLPHSDWRASQHAQAP